MPEQIPTTAKERTTLLNYGKAIERADEELISISNSAECYRLVRAQKDGKPTPDYTMGGQRKLQELCELVLTIANEAGFELTRIMSE